MPRVDLYTTVHKGLRAALFRAALDVARTDFSCRRDARATAASVRSVLDFLDEHGEHEDAVLLPVIALLSPELAADLVHEHTRIDGFQKELRGALDRLEEGFEAERLSLGRRLHERMARLCCEHLRHMEREEQEANRMLQAHRTDDELGALHQRIVGSIAPERVARWLELILPAASAPERRELLAGLSRAVPAPAFEALTSPARAALGAVAWTAALA